MPFFHDFFLQMNEFLAQQSLVRKVIAGVVLLSVLGGLSYLLAEHGSSMTQEVLFADLSSEQAKPVQDELKRLNVTYKMAQDEKGYTIRVPQDKVLELRLELASKVSKTSAGTGWSLFDIKEFGMTAEEMGVKKYRAVKGELERTIAALEMVKSAKVELAMPEPELFVKDRTPPKASVLLTLFPQMSINEEQVHTIQMLVSGSVDGLTADNVVVGDNFGNTLSVDTSSDRIKEKKKLENQERLIAMNEKLRQQTAQEYEKNIVDALTPLFGSKGVKAKVNVEYDHTAREENSKKYDPVAVPVSISDSEKMGNGSKGGKLAVGVVGAARHVENTDAATSATQDASEYSHENIRNNNVGFTESRTTFGSYQIKRITASVVVDNKPVMGTDGKITKTPLGKKELTDIEDTVKGIINFNEKRGAGSGDEVKITNIAFFSPGDSVSDVSVLKELDDKRKKTLYIQYGIYGAVLLALLFFVVRPLMRIMAPAPSTVSQEVGPAAALAEAEKRLLATVGESPHGALPGRPGSAAGELPAPEMPTEEYLKLTSSELDDEIMEFTKTNPKKVALVLRSWMEATGTQPQV